MTRRIPYDEWRLTLDTPMSHQVAKRLTMAGRVKGHKLVGGRLMVHADAPDPRMKHGRPRKAEKGTK